MITSGRFYGNIVTTQAIPGAELAGLIRPGVSELSQWGGLSDPCMILAPLARFLHLLPGVQEWLSPPPRPLDPVSMGASIASSQCSGYLSSYTISLIFRVRLFH